MKKLVTVEEVAEITATSVSYWRTTISKKRPLPRGIKLVKIGRCVRFDITQLFDLSDKSNTLNQIDVSRRRRGRPSKAEQLGRQGGQED